MYPSACMKHIWLAIGAHIPEDEPMAATTEWSTSWFEMVPTSLFIVQNAAAASC